MYLLCMHPAIISSPFSPPRLCLSLLPLLFMSVHDASQPRRTGKSGCCGLLHLRRLNLWPIRGFRCPCGEILLHAACMLRIRSPMVNWSDRLRLPRQSEHRQREGGPARLPSVFPAAGKRSAYKKSEGRINQDCHLKPKSLDQASFQISHFMMHDGRDFGLAHSSKVLLCRPPPSQPKSVKDDRPQPASTRRAPRRRRVIGLSELHSC